MATVYNLKKSLLMALTVLGMSEAVYAGQLRGAFVAEIKVSALNPKVVDGGGGQIVVCKANGKETYESLDRYQARTVFGLKPALSQGQTYLEKIDIALRRFEKVAPVRASLYQSWVREIMTEQISMRKGLVIPQSFSEGQGSVLLPKGNCSLTQVVYQQSQDERSFFGHEKLIEVDADLFESLDEENKAAVILGTVVYLEARTYWQHPDARYARFLTALIMSDSLKTKAAYEQALVRLNEATEPLRTQERGDKEPQLILPEVDFAVGMTCLDFQTGKRTVSACVMTKPIPDTYRCKSNYGDLEIRNFKQKFAVGSIHTMDRDDKSFALSLSIAESYRSDVTLKLNGKEVNAFTSSSLELLMPREGATTTLDCLKPWWYY